MKKVTSKQLIKLLKQTTHSTFATITLITKPRMRKTENPYYDTAIKLSTYNVCLNFDYERSVNRQREREEKRQNFVGEDNWGEHESPCIIKLKGTYYLQCKLEKRLKVDYINSKTNEDLSKAIEPFLYKSYSSKKQDLEKEVICIRPKIDNILTVTMNNETYVKSVELTK